MKSFFARIFSMHPFALAAAVCLIALTIPSYRLLDAERANVGAVPKAIAQQGDETRKFVGDWLTTHLMPPVNRMVDTVDGVPAMARNLIATRVDAGLGEIAAWRKDLAPRVDRTLTLAEGLHQSAKPVLNNLAETERKFGLMADKYAAVPDRLGAELRPSWMALQPEITCRQADGSGYGGCWHSRITGLLGEALKVGGVFTQKFPELADNFVKIEGDFHGILSDGHQWTAKYVVPHPMKKRDYFKAIGKGALGVGIAGLHGGVF